METYVAGRHQNSGGRSRVSADRYLVRSVERALAVLALFVEGDGRLTLAEISAKVGLPQSTVFRLLTTLEASGFIERPIEGGRYQLGLRSLALGSAFLRHNDLLGCANRFLVSLRDACGETIHIGVLEGADVVYLDKLPGLHPIGLMSSRVGSRAPAYCTGLGKAMLAYRSEDAVRALFGGTRLTRFTDNTITDLNQLLSAFDKIRRLGYAIDDGEHEDGVACVAAAVFDSHGVAAAISASGPADRIREQLLKADLVTALLEAARGVSSHLGAGIPGRLYPD